MSILFIVLGATDLRRQLPDRMGRNSNVPRAVLYDLCDRRDSGHAAYRLLAGVDALGNLGDRRSTGPPCQSRIQLM